MGTARADFQHTPGEVDATLEFLKRTRSELRQLRSVRVWSDRFRVIDINKDYFEIRGIGYHDADMASILQNLNANFDPLVLNRPTPLEYKEFAAGRRHPWAEDRVM